MCIRHADLVVRSEVKCINGGEPASAARFIDFVNEIKYHQDIAIMNHRAIVDPNHGDIRKALQENRKDTSVQERGCFEMQDFDRVLMFKDGFDYRELDINRIRRKSRSLTHLTKAVSRVNPAWLEWISADALDELSFNVYVREKR